MNAWRILLFAASCLVERHEASSGGAKIIIDSKASRGSYYAKPSKNDHSCFGLGTCVPVSECGDDYATDVIQKCYHSEKNIFCGVDENFEPKVCCPHKGRDLDVCGRVMVQGDGYAGLGAYPFVVRVGFRNVNSGKVAFPCTGSIIAKNTILTAAHCALAKSDGFKLALVRIGDYDATTEPDCSEFSFCAPPAVNHRISYVIVHPDYTAGEYHHDVALIILKTPMNYTLTAQPVCLRPEKSDLIVGRRVLVIGWGKMSSTRTRSGRIEALDVPLAPWDTCKRVYSTTGALNSPKSLGDQLMCVGGEGRDVCQGFGGSPLVVKEKGLYQQIGILSFGSDACGELRTPSVYSGIAHFYEWISENIPIE